MPGQVEAPAARYRSPYLADSGAVLAITNAHRTFGRSYATDRTRTEQTRGIPERRLGSVRDRPGLRCCSYTGELRNSVVALATRSGASNVSR